MFDLDLPLQEGRDHPWKKVVLDLLDTGVEGALVVARQYRHHSLGDDGPVIHLLIDKMDGDPGDGHPMGQSPSHSVHPGKGR